MKILLFDIDGTLLLTGGSGARAMTRAFYELFGVEDGLKGITLSGMTDPIIFDHACQKAGIEPTEEAHERFKQLYLTYLREEIRKDNSQKRVLPGVKPLLQQLSRQTGVHLGLLTGNYHEGARIKLSHFDLDRFFPFGAFGDDDSDRNRLVPVALRRFHEQMGEAVNGSDVWVIGDTPRDVACAKPYGAKTMAVATGHYDEEELRQAEADVVVKDLSDVDRIVAVLQNS
ncbi:MAG: HAD family hydrolase [candidate division KSB1 bacterium]|nr:HAD family hydrolase [candidate division KSB1 bacterium]MDQ7064421.1 HAD family hydrolase [candidate division KSB1 bacterium]